MAPPGLPDEAAAEDVGRSMSLIRNTLAELVEQAREVFVRCGRAAEAWAILEAGILKARHVIELSIWSANGKVDQRTTGVCPGLLL